MAARSKGRAARRARGGTRASPRCASDDHRGRDEARAAADTCTDAPAVPDPSTSAGHISLLPRFELQAAPGFKIER